jgi:type IV pilus assembly protein PilE
MKRGFSLLELLSVVAITGILLSLAVPAYQAYMQRGERADAIRSMIATANCLERQRANTGRYDTRRCDLANGSAGYELSITPKNQADALEYVIMASPLGDSAWDPCGSLTLDHTGARGISGHADARNRCWSGR